MKIQFKDFLKRNTKTLSWIAWVSLFILMFLPRTIAKREMFYVPIALFIIVYLIKGKYFEAVVSAISTTTLFFIWFEYGIKASMIASLILLPVLIGTYLIRFLIKKKMKKQNTLKTLSNT